MGRVLAFALVLWAAGCEARRPAEGAGLRLVPVFQDFSRPVAMVQAPGEEGVFHVVEKGGRVWRVAADGRRTLFADWRDRVEAGPLGLAFHPRYAENRWVFLSYTAPGAPLRSVLSRVRAVDGRLDPATEEVLLAVAQPYRNHNGGQVAFGPDGFLYWGLGDGGAAGDPLGHGQNTHSLLGAMLRLDVDGGSPYAIPPDNPFADGQGGRPEIYAWGLRNPWRWSFDRRTGALWVGDVGQDRWEEVDILRRGGNYGWALREGRHCYASAPCSAPGLVDPVHEYGHDQGCAVTGGYVYRGRALPALQGAYVFGDFCSGTLWALERQGEGWRARTLLESRLAIASFAEDAAGELYVLDLGGTVYALRPAP